MTWLEDDVSEYQVLQVVTCFAGLRVTFSGVNRDLQLGNRKVTGKKLVMIKLGWDRN